MERLTYDRAYAESLALISERGCNHHEPKMANQSFRFTFNACQNTKGFLFSGLCVLYPSHGKRRFRGVGAHAFFEHDTRSSRAWACRPRRIVL